MIKGKRIYQGETIKSGNKAKKIIIILAVIIALILLFFIARDYIILGKNKETNLVINNRNITSDLKNHILIENGIIYLSKPDVENFFDKHIYEADDKIVTTYDKKIAEIDFKNKKMEVNDSIVEIDAPAIKRDGESYLPISEMKDVYGIEIENYEDTKVITMDSLDRGQKKCTVSANLPVRSSTGLISKTVARVKKGASVIKISETENGWTRVRTEKGKIGYIKSDKLKNEIEVRQDLGEEKQVEGKVNMFWDYYPESKTITDRSGTSIDGVNVVSPSFFHVNSKGELEDNVKEEGKKYIQWAHNNGYKVWPMVSNNGEGMLEVTSIIMNDYEKRKELIKNIVNVCLDYELDGINIDFENMKEEDKDLYSRFIIELTPRIKDIGKVISVDVTAPDGGETWSMCFDRHVIGDVANYIVFMAYDEYGVSSNKAGTTAGFDWVKLSLDKFLKTEEIDSEKIILGIPFYTRLWKENGDGTATSTTVNMKDINRVIPNGIQAQWDDNLKQYYIEYQNNGSIMKLWAEEENSLKAKLSLIKENNLGGVAEWTKDMEDEGIWPIIKEAIQ